MAQPKKHKLSKIVVREISLVDDGMNQHARVSLVKRRERDGGSALAERIESLAKFADTLAGGSPVEPDAAASAAAYLREILMDDLETISKKLDEATEQLEKLSKAGDEAAAALKTATETVAARDAEIVKLKAEGEELKKAAVSKTPEEQDAEFMKGLAPAVRERFEKERAQNKANADAIAKMQDEKEEAIHKAQAATLGVGNVDKLGGLLFRIAKNKATVEDMTALTTILKALGEQLKTSGIFKSIGEGGKAGDADDPEAVLKAKADAIQKADPKLTDAQAYSKALDQNPGLYAEYNKRKRAAAAA